MADSLLQRVASNDPTAVTAVLNQYGGLVWSLARRFSISNEDAEDAVQEVFLDVWRSAERYDPAVASEATFIAMIARRRLIDRARKNARRLDAQSLPEMGIPASFDGKAGNRVELADDANRAAQLFRSLSGEQQRVLGLSIFHGLSHEKIAEATGLPLGTVKTHCRRGLIRIRELVEQNKGPVPQEKVS
ncbi:MAG: sigma-70 family RNA polymerase sigma factor [Planctomycetota bacterium]|nr:sigma-70 family RNA polymerase sigma factor [Planctomycetota bacterium]